MEKCCSKASWRSVVDKGCREVLQRSVVVVWYCFCGVVFFLWFWVFVVVFGCVFILGLVVLLFFLSCRGVL